MELASSIQAIGVNPFPSRFNSSLERFRALIEERANENRAGSKRIHAIQALQKKWFYL